MEEWWRGWWSGGGGGEMVTGIVAWCRTQPPHTTAALSFTKSTAITTAQLSAREKDDTNTSLSFSSRTSL